DVPGDQVMGGEQPGLGFPDDTMADDRGFHSSGFFSRRVSFSYPSPVLGPLVKTSTTVSSRAFHACGCPGSSHAICPGPYSPRLVYSLSPVTTRSRPDTTYVHWVVWAWTWFPRTAPALVKMRVTPSSGVMRRSSIRPRSSRNESAIGHLRLGQGHDELAVVAAFAELRDQGAGDVPREQQRIGRLVFDQHLLIDDGDHRAGHV